MPRRKRQQFFCNLAAKRWKQEERESWESGGQEHEDNEAVDTLEDVEYHEDVVETAAVEKTIRITKKFDLLSDKSIDNIKDNHEANYIFVDFAELLRLLANAKCADCGECALRFALSNEQHGFKHKMVLRCDYCEMSGIESSKSEIYTSKRVRNSKSTGRAGFDVNLRVSTAFSYIGKGYAGIEQFAMIMNMRLHSEIAFFEYSKLLESSVEKSAKIILVESRILAKEAYKKLDSEKLNNRDNVRSESSEIERIDENQTENEEESVKDCKCVNAEINDSIRADNDEKKNEPKDDCVNACVSCDGSWPTRGHKSKHGFGSAIDLLSGFVLDFEVVSKFCQVCAQAIKDLGEDSLEFFFWFEGHATDCPINHSGSSGAMETSAAEMIWRRSIDYGFRLTTMLSGGDAKTFNHLFNLDIYGSEYPLTKEECINHVEKRIYNGITTIVKEEKSRKVTLGGRKHDQLKETTIKKLAEYYKKAIYRNKGDVQAMKNAIYASIYHAVSSDTNPQHSKCPEGSWSWCFYQSALAKNKQPGPHKDNVKTPLNDLCFEKVLPLYERLTDEALLTRCARCLTQNANESLHSVIWNKCPKEVFVSKARVKFAASIAISEYNLGVTKNVTELMKQLGLPIGQHTLSIAQSLDNRKLKRGVLKKNETYKRARRIIALAASRQEKDLLENEGVMYAAGMF